MMEFMRRWKEEMMGKWDRMEERIEGKMEEKMKVIMGELEGIKRREEEWGWEREKLEKRVEELEKKWEEGLKKGGGEGARDLDERLGKEKREGKGRRERGRE